MPIPTRSLLLAAVLAVSGDARGAIAAVLHDEQAFAGAHDIADMNRRTFLRTTAALTGLRAFAAEILRKNLGLSA